MSSYVGFEMADSDDYLGPKMYRVEFQCEKCAHRWFRTLKAIPKKDPPCPNRKCVEVSQVEALQQQVANLTKMLEEQKAPGHIGENTRVKAIDETANIVMEDYNLTNLKDRAEPGESLAPKLPPKQQAAADAYFGGGGFSANQIPTITGQPATHGISAKQMNLLGKRAISGAFRNMAVPPTAIVPGAQTGQSPLRVVRKEQLK